jgi:hypothetical protein
MKFTNHTIQIYMSYKATLITQNNVSEWCVEAQNGVLHVYIHASL